MTKKKIIIPPVPESLAKDKTACQEWEKINKLLIELNTNHKADLMLVELWCSSVVRFREADLKCNTEGTTTVTPNGSICVSPYYTQRNKHQDQLVKLSNMFGFSPSDRAKMKQKKNEDDGSSKWKGMIGK